MDIGITMRPLICLMLLFFTFLEPTDFDAAAFTRSMEREPEQNRAMRLNKTSNDILFIYPAKALEYAMSAASWAKRTENRYELGQAFINQALAYKVMEQFPKALDAIQQALSLVENSGDPKQVARVRGYVGLILSDMGDLRPSIQYALAALDYYRQAGDLRGVASLTNNIGARLYRLGEYQQSLEYLFESLRAEEERRHPLGMANNLNCIGISFIALQEPQKARTYLERARDVYTELNEKHGLAQTFNNLGICCKDEKDLDLALFYYEKSRGMAVEIGNQVLLGENLLNIGEIHALRGEYGKAMSAYEESLELAVKTDDFNAVAFADIKIGGVHLLLGQSDQAVFRLNKGLSLAREKGYQELMLESLEQLKEQYKKLGEQGRALTAMEELLEVRGRILSEKKNRAIAELDARYRLDKKDEELGLLRRDQELQHLKLATERQRFYIAALAAVLFLVTLLWLGKRYRRLFVFWKKKSYFGHYQVGERLGGGGMGDVFKAYSVRDAKIPVALKLLREEYARDPLLRKRFLNEARVIDQLDHPSIVKVLERGETNDRLYLAMEFIDGKTLADIIKEHPRLPIEFCVEVMKQLLDAVAALHRQGVLHRDLKPENVMVLKGLMNSPQVKLMDFDLARDVRMTPLTQTGELLGTLPYMPPERIRNQVCSEPGDLYSLGVLFYEMLTGEKPFPADTPVEIMKQILDSEPIPASRLRDDLPKQVVQLISSLLSKEASTRPSVSAFRKQLCL